jgi:CubicO group peptidase (beta-lactamase class C family)
MPLTTETSVKAHLLHAFVIIALLCVSSGGVFAQANRMSAADHIGNLADPDPAVRWRTITALAKGGSGAVPQLMEALAGSDERVRSGSAAALGHMGNAAAPATPALVAALSDTSASVREEAAAALGPIGSSDGKTVDGLVRCLADNNAFVVGKAAGTLGHIGASAVPALGRALGSSDRRMRHGAAIALGKAGRAAAPAAPALAIALADSSEDVRYVAADALGRIGRDARAAVPGLLRTLSDADADVRSAAILALDHIAPEATEFHGRWKDAAAVIDSLMPSLMRDIHVPGVSVAVVQDDRIVWTHSYGITNALTGATVTDSTLFEACSMSKPVLAVIALRLAEGGLLDLDRPLIRYLELPSMGGQPGADRVTARMVLSHTTGLPNWRKGDDERDGPLPVAFPPGSRFGYSGEAIFYLQRVIERITGEPFDIFARRELFAPAGLHHMNFAWTPEISGAISGGHDGSGKYITTSRYTHPNAAYTLYTSAAEYARFICGIMASAKGHAGLLTPETFKAMRSHQVPVPAREPIQRPGRARATSVWWGLGWGINTTAQGDILHHSGANLTGFRCFSQFNPSTGSGIVIMTNSLSGTDLWTRLIARIGNL